MATSHSGNGEDRLGEGAIEETTEEGHQSGDVVVYPPVEMDRPSDIPIETKERQ